jgi:hypothetical protein
LRAIGEARGLNMDTPQLVELVAWFLDKPEALTESETATFYDVARVLRVFDEDPELESIVGCSW